MHSRRTVDLHMWSCNPDSLKRPPSNGKRKHVLQDSRPISGRLCFCITPKVVQAIPTLGGMCPYVFFDLSLSSVSNAASACAIAKPRKLAFGLAG